MIDNLKNTEIHNAANRTPARPTVDEFAVKWGLSLKIYRIAKKNSSILSIVIMVLVFAAVITCSSSNPSRIN